ncbi:MAG: hypothetical protein LV473_19545, partial [Nitrospira sp.]|nr:hypothetical protein [Nitrospira sp.]
MKTIMALMSVLLLSACIGLNPKNSTMGDIGEVAWRTAIFPVTLGLSEAILKHSREEDARQEYEARAARKERRAYRDWYQKLSPEDKDREDQRSARQDAMLLQRAAIANQALQNEVPPIVWTGFRLNEAHGSFPCVLLS